MSRQYISILKQWNGGEPNQSCRSSAIFLRKHFSFVPLNLYDFQDFWPRSRVKKRSKGEKPWYTITLKDTLPKKPLYLTNKEA